MTGLKAKHNQASALVAQMSLQEKTTQLSGDSFWYLAGNERLEIPRVMITDGPHGLRKQARQADHVGAHRSVPATCFPTACALASSWNPVLLEQIGQALGDECVAEQVTVLLGPGMNIKRHPLCGRNFEYFSEDPLLTGKLAAALVRGVQSRGVGTSIKHFAANNQEHGRMTVDAIVDERTLRELYLRGFEIAVREAQPWTVMCAYNRLNGTYCSEHDWLLNQVLRDDWGFEGLVVTDWGAANDRPAGVAAGLDLEMPGSGGMNNERVLRAVQAGELDEAVVDRAVVRTVSLNLLGADLATREQTIDGAAHHALARQAAVESAVLLSNNGLLPLAGSERIAVVGAFAQRPRYQGAGSSQVNPRSLDDAWTALQAAVDDSATLTFAAGYDGRLSAADQTLIDEAVAAAQHADVVVLFAGLPGLYESEGFDRSHMALPAQQDALIEAVCAANPRTVVVLANGAPVVMPWAEQPAAILESYLAGQAGGSAVVDLLLGAASPSGKLAETFPLAQGDLLADAAFPGSGRQVQYREGLYVGYRYFDSADVAVRFPFGHGLSYTRFDYGQPSLSAAGFQPGDRLQLSVPVTNAGERDGAEVVQLYVAPPAAGLDRPAQELKGFAKLAITAGETGTARIEIDDSAFAIYDRGDQSWKVLPGVYELRIGASSRDLRQRVSVTVRSGHVLSVQEQAASSIADPAERFSLTDASFARRLGKPVPAPESARPFHLNSAVDEISETWLGRQVRKRMVARFAQSMGGGSSDETLTKMFDRMAREMPLRSMALFSGGKISIEAVEALVAALNGRYLDALRRWWGARRG
jgi:beta-glucosidase